MSTAKVRIDQSNGIIEVEGPIEFVKEVYADFRDEKISAATSAPKKVTKAKAKTPSAGGVKTNSKKPSGDGKLDKTLDLSGPGKTPSLQEFVARYKANNNKAKIYVFISYLKDVLNLEKVNIDHLYTCFDDTGKIPGALKQTLYNISSEGFIVLPSVDDVSLAVKGINWLKANKTTDEKSD